MRSTLHLHSVARLDVDLAPLALAAQPGLAMDRGLAEAVLSSADKGIQLIWKSAYSGGLRTHDTQMSSCSTTDWETSSKTDGASGWREVAIRRRQRSKVHLGRVGLTWKSM